MAFYGVVNEVFDRLEMKEDVVPYVVAEVAVRIDDAIQRKLVVDWRTNPDVQNQMRNEIDDLLYEAKGQKELPLTTEDMDAIVERSIDIAKNRYPR